jgi:hypothetical protein
LPSLPAGRQGYPLFLNWLTTQLFNHASSLKNLFTFGEICQAYEYR